METLKIRKELHKFVDKADETFIRIFYAMASEYNKTEIDFGNYFIKKQFLDDIKEAEAEIEQGYYKEIEDFEKETETWK